MSNREHMTTTMNMKEHNGESEEIDTDENTVMYAIGHTLGYIHGFIIGVLFRILFELSRGFQDGYPKFHPKQRGGDDE